MKTIRIFAVILLTLLVYVSAYARVETVRFQSKLVKTSLSYNLVLPPDYDTAQTTRYPVLYLLHGLTGHYSDWVQRTNIDDYAAEYSLIVVTPEGNDGWYTDHSWAYWNRQVQEILKIAAEKMRLPRPNKAMRTSGA